MSEHYRSVEDGDDPEIASAFHVERIADGVGRVAQAITANAAPGHDATGAHVECLTEAVMGMTQALSDIAEAINRIASALEDQNT